MKSIVVALALITAGSAAFAQSSASQGDQSDAVQAQQDSAQKGKEEAEELICRRVGPAATGSQLGQRTCLTREQWRARNRRR